MSGSLYDIDPLLPWVEAGFVLLTPNFRLARRIKAEWDARRSACGDAAWEPLPVQPLESWLQTQWHRAVALGLAAPRAPLGQAQELELWQQVIAEEEKQSDEYHLLRPAAAAELARQARDKLLRWEVDVADEGIRQSFTFDADCGTFLRWQARFEQRLAQAEQCTSLDCIRGLRDCAAALPSSPVVLIEFDDVPPLFRSVLEGLCKQVQEYQPDGDRGDCRLHACGDKRTELRTLARWASDIHQQEPQATVGIVLSDISGDRTALEYLLRQEFGCLGENYNALPVNFSTGISLDRAPVVRDALAALALALPQVRVAQVVQLLQSRFLSLPDSQSALANRFVTRLYDDGREQVDVADLRYAANAVILGEHKGLALGRHLLALSGMRELRRQAAPSGWVERFSEVLAQWGWPGVGPLDSLEYQQVELWYRTLDEFRAYDAVCAELDYEQALQLLRHSCSGQMSQPQTPDSNIQVLGPLEAAGLNFDYLWLAGMQGSSWPAPARPNPFVPQALQRRLQMPHATAAREWAFGAALFKQYTRSAPLVHASYCAQLDGIPDLPSAFLQGFTPEPLPALPAVNASWMTQWQARAMESLADEQAPPLDEQQLQAMRGGSGLLEDQSQCPFRAFARRRLNVHALADFSVALSAADRGSLLHEALYALWGDLCDHQTLLAMDEAGVHRVVQHASQSAVQTIPGGRRRLLGAAYWRLEARRLEGLLLEWLAVERQRSAFVVYQREQAVELQLGQLRVSLRVDRIDQLPDGSRVIIDYKSGASRVLDWMGERPAKPQLLLYGIAAPGSAAALAFAQVRARDSCYVGLGQVQAAPGIRTDIPAVVGERMEAGDWDSLNQRWAENLQRLAAEFVSGEAAVDPLAPASCAWCGLQPLCRVNLARGEGA